MSVLQRKARAGKQEHQARAMTVAKALRVSFAKVADKLLDLALAVIGVTRERCDGDQLPDKIDEAGLLLLLDGPGGATGGPFSAPDWSRHWCSNRQRAGCILPLPHLPNDV